MTLHNTTVAANQRAQARADEHGFASEAEMLPFLYKTMSTKCMGEILEVHAATVRFRLTKLHVKLRPRGGKRNFAGRPKKVVSSKIVVVKSIDNRPPCPRCSGRMTRSAEWLKQWVCLKCGKTAPLDPVEPVEDDIVTIHRVGCRGHSKGSGRRKQQMNCGMDFGFEDVYG